MPTEEQGGASYPLLNYEVPVLYPCQHDFNLIKLRTHKSFVPMLRYQSSSGTNLLLRFLLFDSIELLYTDISGASLPKSN
jgi:hypothetical protein